MEEALQKLGEWEGVDAGQVRSTENDWSIGRFGDQ